MPWMPEVFTAPRAEARRKFVGTLGRTRTCALLIRSDRVSAPTDLRWSPSVLIYGLLLGK